MPETREHVARAGAEAVSESTTTGYPTRERPWARAALVGLTIVSGRR